MDFCLVSIISQMQPTLIKVIGCLTGVIELLRCKNLVYRLWHQNVVIWINVLWFIDVSIQQRIRETKQQ